MYLKEIESILGKICTSIFIAVLFTIAKIWMQPRCPPVDESIKRCIHIYTKEYYLAVKTSTF